MLYFHLTRCDTCQVDLRIITYRVTATSHDQGLVQWVPGMSCQSFVLRNTACRESLRRDVFGTCPPPSTSNQCPDVVKGGRNVLAMQIGIVASPMLPVLVPESFDLQRILDEHGDIRLFFQVLPKPCPVLSAPEMVEMARPRHVCHIIACSCPHLAFHFRTLALPPALPPCLSLTLYLIRNLPLLQSQTALLNFKHEPWRKLRAHVCCSLLGVQT